MNPAYLHTVVPCKWCEKPTPMTGTRMCERCFELDNRIADKPALAARILAHYVERMAA